MSPPTTATLAEWSFETNNRLYHSLTQEQRDANLQPLLPLTTNFSLDYPNLCTALHIQPHPILLAHTAQFERPPPPPVAPAQPLPTVSTLPLPDASVAVQSVLSPPTTARKSPRPAATTLTKGGKKAEVKTPAAKAGKKEEPVAVVVEKKEEEVQKKEEIPADERDTLSLTHTSIDDGTVAALAIALAVNRHIRCLQLQYSTMTEAGVRLLAAVVSKSCVQRLYVERITLTPLIDSSAPHPLLTILPALAASNVQLLSLSGNALTDSDGAAIATSITNNPTLAALTLSNNHLATSTTTALAATLLLNTTLAYLNLNHNPLTTPHLIALLQPLTSAPVDPPPKQPPAAAKGAQPPLPLPYRVVVSKETKACWREANATLRQLWCSGCGIGSNGGGSEKDGGGGVVERIRQVLAVRQVGAIGGAEGSESGSSGGSGVGLGQYNVLERLSLERNDLDDSEWAELSGMGPVVTVETAVDRSGKKHVRPCAAPVPASATTTADVVAPQSAVVAAA